MRTLIVVLVLSCLTATASLAQDFNIDLADHFGTPPNSYGAAGLPGLWNNINGMLPTDPPLPLLKIDGSSSSVTIHTTGGMTAGWMAGPATGSDEALLEDWMAASDYASDVQISGLQNGPYLIRVYGINTADPNWTMSFDIAGTMAYTGGAWTGVFVQGVTHATVLINVTGGTLPISYAGNSHYGGAFCGLQIEFSPTVPVQTSTWGRIKANYDQP